MNYSTGAPGSYFVFYLTSFPPNTSVGITLNGVLLATIVTNAQGYAIVVLATDSAEAGSYTLVASVASSGAQARTVTTASTRFTIAASAPVRPLTETGVTPLDVPADIAQSIVLLPLVQN